MTLEEIKSAVAAGQVVHWSSANYRVTCNTPGQYLITCAANGHAICLTWRDGVTLNGKPSEFYVA